MKKLMEILLIFIKIGTFTIGGGYAMIPLIEKEVVDKKKWIDKDDFVDMLALAQSSPGPIAVNVSVFVGYKVAGIPGSIFAVLGAILTAFLILLIVAMYFIGIKDNPIVERIFKGIRPAVVALIAAPVIRMGKNAKINRKTIFIPIATVILVGFLKVNPIYVIIVSALCGILYGIIKKRRIVK
ncbi:chromate transporter [Clostridium sp. JN-9]|nr:chromate transporter [Clostridium sp. JN-9]